MKGMSIEDCIEKAQEYGKYFLVFDLKGSNATMKSERMVDHAVNHLADWGYSFYRCQGDAGFTLLDNPDAARDIISRMENIIPFHYEVVDDLNYAKLLRYEG